MKSKEKVNKIINEIENSSVQSNKNVKEIMDILLNDNTTKISITNDTINYKCDMYEFNHWCSMNNSLFNVNYYRNIYSQRKIIGHIIIFVKRVIRKLIKFLIEPIVLDQNAFNSSVTASINAIYNNTIVFQNIINSTINELNSTKDEINILKKQIKEINKK